MKNFLVGVFAAVLAGILVFVSQREIERASVREELVFTTVHYPPLYITPEIAKTIEDYSSKDPDALESSAEVGGSLPFDGEIPHASVPRLKMTLVEIANQGDGAVDDFDVRIVSTKRYGHEYPGIYAIVDERLPNNDSNNTSSEVEYDGVHINYDLIMPGEEHLLWVISDPDAEILVKQRDSGVTTMDFGVGPADWRMNLKIYEARERSYQIAILISIIAGLISATAFIHWLLRRRGHNLVRLMRGEVVPRPLANPTTQD